MSGSTTSETDEVGGNGETVSDLVEAADLVEVFGNDDSNDIAVWALPPKARRGYV